MSSIGKFQIIQALGTGAHSTILHVRRASDSKQYALKVVPILGPSDHKFLEQARHEYRVAQMLNHPNIIKIHAIDTRRDWLFRIRKVRLLIEFINGRPIDQVQGLSIPRLVQVFSRIASALAHMHRRGVYHADLKPSNIMLSRTGDVRIIDLGLAWVKGEDKDRIQGTPEYMAPEQSKKSIANEKSDLYNFGATMYRLVTWRLPPSTMPSTGQVAMSSKVFAAQLRPVEEIIPHAPPALCDVIHRCLAFKPEKRPERALEVHEILQELEQKLVIRPEDRLDHIEWK